MNLSARTLLCNVASRLTSYFNWNFPLRVEPVGLKRWLLQKKEIPWNDAVDGNKVLELCPELSKEDLAALIERQIKNEDVGLAPIFARPYALLERSRKEGTDGLSVTVALPVTSTPHVIYRFGVKEFDFSKVYFERENVQTYISDYTAKAKLIAAKKKSAGDADDSSSRPAWKMTIEKCTVLLVDLYEGRQAPVTKDKAKDLVCINKEAFESWWKNVPDKFKAGAGHSSKKK